jgi:hypothetical protein
MLRLLNQERSRCESEGIDFGKTAQLGRLMRIAAQRFPPDRADLLPTSFGNAVQAFEDYPRVMFEFESITGWSRLNAVIPKDFRELIGSRRALTDFWINVWALSIVTVLEYVSIVLGSRLQFPFLWVPALGLATAFFSSWQARIAAEQWGEWVKAAFDVYLPALREKLGYLAAIQPRRRTRVLDDL